MKCYRTKSAVSPFEKELEKDKTSNFAGEKVLFVCWCATTHVYLLAREVAKLGYDVFIVLQDNIKPRFSIFDGLNIYRVDFENFQGLTHCLAGLIQRHNIDIVHDALSALVTATILWNLNEQTRARVQSG